MKRRIVCFQVPALAIALARMREPLLRDRPVAAADRRSGERAIITEASAEAYREGVCPGMPVGEARWLYPALRIVSVDCERIGRAHDFLFARLRRFAPACEAVAAGRFYLDLTGGDRLLGTASGAAARAGREIREQSGLKGAIGIAGNKLVAGIAADLIESPPDLCDIGAGAEKRFLAPLPAAFLTGLRSLYRGKSSEILDLLDDLNLGSLGKIAATDLAHLNLVLGPQSRLIHQWAAGIDPTPVWPPALRPSLECSHALEPDEVDDDLLLAAAYGLLERLCAELRRAERPCGKIKLELLQSDGRQTAREKILHEASFWEADLYPALQELFFLSFTRRVRIRKITLGAQALQTGEMQLGLFPEAVDGRARLNRLSVALDRVRAKHGARALVWG